MSSIFGGGSSTVTQAPLGPEEQALVKVNTQLAKQQLANINQLAPFQKELLDLTMADLKRQGAESAAFDAAVTPEQRAAASKSEFERAQRLGPIQDQLLEQQLANMRGELTPAQQASVDATIKATHGDIDAATQQGIGLISDELANSRGLRLTDTPILREATLLSERGLQQKSSASANIRANAMTQFPTAASGINLNQQGVLNSAQQFQDQLRQQAFQNRMALTGTTANTGIGLSSRGASFGPQSQGSTTTSNPSFMQTAMGIGGLAAGVGALAPFFSDRRIKKDYGVVAKTDSGIDLHVYRYRWESDNDPLRLGVMAQDVEKVKPGAVGTYRGVKYVDYARL